MKILSTARKSVKKLLKRAKKWFLGIPSKTKKFIKAVKREIKAQKRYDK